MGNKVAKIEEVKRLDSLTKVRVPIPGIQILHSRSSEEIGEVLSKLIHSQTNLVEIKLALGKYIELTIDNTPPDGIEFKQVY